MYSPIINGKKTFKKNWRKTFWKKQTQIDMSICAKVMKKINLRLPNTCHGSIHWENQCIKNKQEKLKFKQNWYWLNCANPFLLHPESETVSCNIYKYLSLNSAQCKTALVTVACTWCLREHEYMNEFTIHVYKNVYAW